LLNYNLNFEEIILFFLFKICKVDILYAIIYIMFSLFRLVQVLVISFGGVYALVFVNLTIVASLEQYENKVS